METLEIDNFLSIKSAHIEIRKFNVLIGPQASGKSIIAKLTYFFESILQKSIPEAVQSLSGKRDLDRSMTKRFESIFPRHTWEGTSFSLYYVNDQIEIRISGSIGAKSKTLLKIDYSKNIYNLFNRMKLKYQQYLIEARKQESTLAFNNVESQAYHSTVKDILSNSSFQKNFSNPVFIPASRSFFANLQKNIFSFLASNIEIDPFLKDFGSIYETSKFMYRSRILSGSDAPSGFKKVHEEVSAISKKIICGEYEYFDDQDWIIQRGRRTNLANGSSGQQESLPMLVVLSFTPLVARRGPSSSPTIFIEEPEAHLFPFAQNLILSALSVLKHETETRFFITTHSPYILSSINNLMYAHEISKNRERAAEKVESIIKPSKPLAFEDVSAYTINGGKAKSILDQEEKLISTSFIDSTSDFLEKEFDSLMEAELF